MAGPDDLERLSFLGHWFDGFARGLARLPEPEREALLTECALACGRSFTVRAFQDAWAGTGELDAFLARLGRTFPDATYERAGERTVRVSLRRCGCDLVTAGWVRTPLLCRCSAHNLRENFSRALGRPVEVTLGPTILGGAPRCELTVELG